MSSSSNYYSSPSVNQKFHSPPKNATLVRKKIEFGPFQPPKGISLKPNVASASKKRKATPPVAVKGKAKTPVRIKGKANTPLPLKAEEGPKWKGKEVIELSSDSDPCWSSSNDSERGNGFISPDLCDQVKAFHMLDDQAMEDSWNRKKKVKVPSKKKGKFRFVKVFVGGEDLSETGYAVQMTGDLRFEKLYEKYGGWQKYSPADFDLWYRGEKIAPDATPDDLDMTDQTRVVARGRYSWMNMDSRLVTVNLVHMANRPDGVRLTLRRTEPMTLVYDRIANMTGVTLTTLRVGCEGDVIDIEGVVGDTLIKNEDQLWYMNYSSKLKFNW